MDEYVIGLIGWGTVGGGVLEILQQDGELLQARTGLRIRLKTIVTRDPERARPQSAEGIAVTTDLTAIVDDPEIRCVLHLVGGTEDARDIAHAVLSAGKHLVTANKALLAEHWSEICQLAQTHRAAIAFEAAVAGGIPVIAALRDGLVANKITGLYGILNGTCNYVLTQMEDEGLEFDEAVAQAKALGYAEEDPTLDIDGTDTAHKLAILAQIAFTTNVSLEAISVEGIQDIGADDIASAKRMNCRIKLLAVAKQRAEGIELRVAPTLVPLSNPLAWVGENYNAVYVLADNAGPTQLIGQGAGALPTASAVLADLVEVATGSYERTAAHFRFFDGGDPVRVLGEDEENTASYGRFHVRDQAGALATIMTKLRDHGISLLAVHQGEPSDDGTAIVEITTHPSVGGEFLQAVREIDAEQVTVSPSVILRRLDEES